MEEEKKEPMEEQQAEPKEEPKAEAVEQPQQAAPAQERPTFLTVLCILSFIGVGIQIIQGLISLFAKGAGSMIMEAAESLEGYEEVPGTEYIEESLSYASTLGIVSILAALVCLWGVIWMWNLKKTGYYIYIVGELAPVIVSFILVGFGSFLGGFFAMIGLIFPVLFIILYGLNVKHMS
jgi:hypothetical protein